MIFQETEISPISGSNFPSSKNKKPTLKELNKTPSGKTGCLSKHSFLRVAQASNFLIHLLPLTQLVRLPGVTYHLLCSRFVTYGHQVLPTQALPKEAEDFPSDGKHFKHVSLVT